MLLGRGVYFLGHRVDDLAGKVANRIGQDLLDDRRGQAAGSFEQDRSKRAHLRPRRPLLAIVEQP